MRAQTLLIQTPEGVSFAYPLASPVTRFLAWAIDLGCISVLGTVLASLLAVLQVVSLDLWQAALVVGYFVLSVGYGMATEWWWRGQTVGKRVLRLRVLDAQGLRLRPSQVVLRNLLRFVDSLPAFYLVGGVAMLLGRQAQRLGDLAANTVVVRHPRMEEPDLDELAAGKYNSLRAYPHLAARLRQRITPEEAALGIQALLRRDQLEPEARVRLFRRLADHYRSRVRFPPEAEAGVADEQYVRNVIEVVFRPQLGSAGQAGRVVAPAEAAAGEPRIG